MLNITELKAKAVLTGMSIVDVEGGLYQIHTDTGYAIGKPDTLEHLNNADKCGVFEDFEEVDDEQGVTEFLCTNGANSSFRVWAADADVALMMAERRFDSESDYMLPINVESECGACATLDEPVTISYTDDELGLNDDI